MSELVITALH